MSSTADCPICGASLQMSALRPGDSILCSRCGVNLLTPRRPRRPRVGENAPTLLLTTSHAERNANLTWRRWRQGAGSPPARWWRSAVLAGVLTFLPGGVILGLAVSAMLARQEEAAPRGAVFDPRDRLRQQFDAVLLQLDGRQRLASAPVAYPRDPSDPHHERLHNDEQWWKEEYRVASSRLEFSGPTEAEARVQVAVRRSPPYADPELAAAAPAVEAQAWREDYRLVYRYLARSESWTVVRAYRNGVESALESAATGDSHHPSAADILALLQLSGERAHASFDGRPLAATP